MTVQVFISLTFSLPCLSPEYKTWVFPVVLPSTLPLTSITLTGEASRYLVLGTSCQVAQCLHVDEWSHKTG